MRSFPTSRDFLLVAVLATHIPANAAAQSVRYQRIAFTGDSAPGVTDGAEFDGFSTVAINNNGQLAFQATLRSGADGDAVGQVNDQAIFGPTPAGLGLIARENEVPPDIADGFVYSLFRRFLLNDNGQVAISATLRAPNGDIQQPRFRPALFGPTQAGLGLIAQRGDPVPGTHDGAQLVSFFSPVLNNTGEVAFLSNFMLGGTGTMPFPPPPRDVVLKSTNGSLSLLARTGSWAPGEADGPGATRLYVPSLNDSGHVAFLSSFEREHASESPAVNLGLQFAINGPTAAGTDVVVQDGEVFSIDGSDSDRIKVALGPTRFSLNRIGGLAFPVIDDAGESFVVRLPAPSQAGEPIVTQMDGFSVRRIALNSSDDLIVSGQLGAQAEVSDGRRLDDGIFRLTGAGVTAIALEGSPVPGVTDGAVFGGREMRDIAIDPDGSVSVGFADSGFLFPPLLNDSGDVAFLAPIRTGLRDDGANYARGLGLFAHRQLIDETVLIARTGDVFDVSDHPGVEDLRTIASISFERGIPTDTSNNENGSPARFNDAGQLAFILEFADGSEGLFVASLPVPEPSSGFLLAIFWAVFAWSRSALSRTA